MPLPQLSVRTALAYGTEHLSQRPDLREYAARDAQQLLEVATGISRVAMLAHPDRVLREEEAGSYRGMVAQRRGGVPIQHLRGSQEFFGRGFLVTPDVLIPRPETEGIVEECLRLFPDRNTPLRLADVGTGSGVLAITLALEYPRSSVVALDISPAALHLARQNAEALAAAGRIQFLHSDLFAAVDAFSQFDVVVSNPPYIPLGEAAGLHPQVREHEPHVALFSGEDGLDVIRRLLPQAREHLRPGGWLLMETAGRAPALEALLHGGWQTHFCRDLQGTERIAAAHVR